MPGLPRAVAMLLVVLGSMLLAPADAARAQAAQARAPVAPGNYVQIEAHRDAATALARAAEWGAGLPGVAVFAMPTGWQAIALGPYGSEAEARAALVQLRAAGRIPGDSYLATAADYRGRVGGGPTAPMPAAPDPVAAPSETVSDTPPETPSETLAEARAAERALDRPTRADIQRALAWFGHYGGAIDAAFGPGTRRAIAAWQTEQGAAPTGVLRGAERAELLVAWRAERDRLGLRTVTEDAAGIRAELPLGLVARAGARPPFIRYEGPDGLTVLLLSQPGDRLTLRAFYDIFQTLEAMPADGPREIAGDSFAIEGRDADRAAIARARLADGHVKGWLAAWPRGLDAPMRRAIPALRDSFAALDGAVLPRADAPAPGAAMLGGVALRQPVRTASGAFVTADGAVLTLAETVTGCGRLTVDHGTAASLAARQGALALLRPETPLAPMAVAVPGAVPPEGAELRLAGFPFGGRLGAASVNSAVLRAVEAPGAPGRMLVEIRHEPGEAGAPLLTPDGDLAGLLARPDGPRALPPGLAHAVPAGRIAAFLAGAGVSRPASTDGGAGAAAPIDARVLAGQARGMAVLVSCWE